MSWAFMVLTRVVEHHDTVEVPGASHVTPTASLLLRRLSARPVHGVEEVGVQFPIGSTYRPRSGTVGSSPVRSRWATRWAARDRSRSRTVTARSGRVVSCSSLLRE